ncbi:transporter substrate-binding domain-containing protein [Gloeobacter kilaueensis]|uniref:Bifunctional adhesin/ABC transporter aspartate/glutamate-binding protein n=1 Tax=Gloeobacter kilaueensis (strain ATCC BAA-2537 / CCAP 1431/1 / ULC 316 / JS1) TaxID=1183438 RepID=U5QNL4_GLOK1|nr:transporter substrate-binding domain-containing protein [Gloeobacter kilaueensis]AGY60516.1 bifunctional adhesin/ABC transporter aspartate/glutamate-binding protein [Gloeobacter kilaueensis JS1]
MRRRLFALAGPMLIWAALPLPLQAAPLEAIRQRQYLIVAVKDDLFPLGFRSRGGELAGFEIDLARALATALFGRPDALKLVAVRNQDRLALLQRQQVDLVIANLSVSVPRARAVDYSYPYLTVSQAVLLKQGDTSRTLGDLDRAQLAVLAGSNSEQALHDFLPHAVLVPVASYAQGVEAVAAAQVSGFAADSSVLGGWAQFHPAYRLLGTDLGTSGLAVAMPRGLASDSLRRWVNEQIAQLLKQGWLAERARFWGLAGRS